MRGAQHTAHHRGEELELSDKFPWPPGYVCSHLVFDLPILSMQPWRWWENTEPRAPRGKSWAEAAAPMEMMTNVLNCMAYLNGSGEALTGWTRLC